MLLAGLANGSYAAALVLTVRTIFSIDVAKHYNSIFFFDLIGVIFFNRLLFGEIMTRNSVIGPEGQPQCLGRDKCLRTTFIVMACLSAFAFVASLTMHIVYMRFVRDKWAENSGQRDEEQMEDHESFLDSTD
ncbi:hypothetical protein DQ04_06061050 [Trypanosoma grayi]|uniref:hypothetical protein n=1 Tax=Trypanosoma grayi TaxID=71804 RepID=UPI0004F43515|nr:hypothetical protein DQ04_06061050 [Trypanosoma grayi]KEG08978.1 hypothetical protein DQ04_06061050 [Trypanosoma grayi]